MNSPIDFSTIHFIPLEQRILGPVLRGRAELDGDRTYMRFEGRSWSFGDTFAIARNLASAFKEAGFSKGERLGLFVPNVPEFILSWYGVNLIGGVTVPINPSYTQLLLEYIANDSDVRGIVTTRELLPIVNSLSPERLAKLRFVLLVDGDESGRLGKSGPTLLSFAALASRSTAGMPDPEITQNFRDEHSIMYTSGTTGPSKGAMVPNGHYFTASCVFLRAVDLQRDDILFTPLPLFHGLASRLGALPALMVGAEYNLAARFSATQFWRQVTECRATVAHTIFTLPNMLKAQPPGEYDRAHRLRVMYNSGYDAEFERRFNVRLAEAYGMTEVGLTHYTPYNEPRREGSCGMTHPDWESRLVDEMGRQALIGEVGEMVLRPKLPGIMMSGYLNKPLETLRMTRDLWFHSGDYARCDADGYYYFVSRAKERIRRRGENISPAEVEGIICTHEEVGDCAALAHPALEGEDDVRTVVARKEGSTLQAKELMDWLQGRMPNFMMPRYVEFIDVLPRNPAGKIEKYKLLEAGLAHDAWDRDAVGYKLKR